MSYSADLQISLLSSKQIRIENNLITYAEKTIVPSEIIGYGYEKHRIRIQGILRVEYHIILVDKNENDFKIIFGCGSINEENMDKHYVRILKEFRLLFGLRLLQEMYNGLINGKEISFSKWLKARPQGIVMVRTSLFSKATEKIVRWEDIDFSIRGDGNLILKGLGDEKEERISPFSYTNIPVLHMLLNYLHEDSDRIAAIYSANGIAF